MLVNHLIDSIARSKNNELIKDVTIDGMSSAWTKGLLNNLLSKNFVSYLEIGVWKGSTFVSALYKNNPKQAIAIDNFSEFNNGTVRAEFLANIEKWMPAKNYQFFDCDCFSFNKNKITQPVNVYFYDGNHSEESHKLALDYYYSSLADEFIFLVDDWNWDQVKKGTRRSMTDLKLKIEYEVSLPGSMEHDVGYWNGLYAAVLTK